jgi:hypothetical protein
LANFEIGKPVETDEPTVEVTLDSSNPLPVGQHVFELVVVDDSGNKSVPARASVVVRDNEAPTAVIRAPSQVGFAQSFKLDGSASIDRRPGKVVHYTWTLVN